MSKYGKEGMEFCRDVIFEKYKGSNKFCFWDLMNIDLISVFRKKIDIAFSGWSRFFM